MCHNRSFAAWVQSILGAVKAGGWFATFQSAAVSAYLLDEIPAKLI